MTTTINRELMLEVAQHIRTHAKNFNMLEVVRVCSSNEDESHTEACNTEACIAGWAILLSKEKTTEELAYSCTSCSCDEEDWQTIASRKLGLTGMESDRLFFRCNWPSLYADAFHKASRDFGRKLITHEEKKRVQAEIAATLLEDVANGVTSLARV